jgi:ssDNA-binding replication factor A large subunit
MIKIPLQVIIDKIKEKTGLTDKEIQSKIKDKLDLLSGLISEEGAAHIIANELGVKIFEDPGKLQIKNVLAGMRNVELTGRIVKIYETKNFEKENRKGKLCSFLIGDPTGIIRVVAWNDKVDLLTKMKENDTIKIENGYAKENNGRKEVHLGDKTKVTFLQETIEVKETTNERKKISELKGGEENVEIMGAIVQVFDPKFFEVCPECGKRVREKEGEFVCEQHNAVSPAFSYVFNLFLDDSSDTIRVVLWRNQAQKLLGLTNEEIIERKEGTFDEVKNDLLGKIVKFSGRATKNEMFERIEFVPQLVFTDLNPEEEIERINNEIKEPLPEEKEPEAKKPDPIVKEKVEDISEKDDLLEEIDDIKDLDSL